MRRDSRMIDRIGSRSRSIAGTLALTLLIALVATLVAEDKSSKTPSKIGRKPGTPKHEYTSKQEYTSGDVHVDRSFVYILVDKTGLGHQHAVVGKLKEGRITLNPPKAGGRLVFDMGTFDADGEAARKYVGLQKTIGKGIREQVNANMLGESVLHVQKYPTA